MLWDLNDNKHLYTLDSGDTINALCFSPNRYWLCAATGNSIKIWVNILIFKINQKFHFVLFKIIKSNQDLEHKIIVDELKAEITKPKERFVPQCVSLAWSADGQTLYSGYTDNVIRVWQVSMTR